MGCSRASEANDKVMKREAFCTLHVFPSVVDVQQSTSQSSQQTGCFCISLLLFWKRSELFSYQVLLLSVLSGPGSRAASQHSGGFEGNVTLYTAFYFNETKKKIPFQAEWPAVASTLCLETWICECSRREGGRALIQTWMVNVKPQIHWKWRKAPGNEILICKVMPCSCGHPACY